MTNQCLNFIWLGQSWELHWSAQYNNFWYNSGSGNSHTYGAFSGCPATTGGKKKEAGKINAWAISYSENWWINSPVPGVTDLNWIAVGIWGSICSEWSSCSYWNMLPCASGMRARAPSSSDVCQWVDFLPGNHYALGCAFLISASLIADCFFPACSCVPFFCCCLFVLIPGHTKIFACKLIYGN